MPAELHAIAARCVDECVRQEVGLDALVDLLAGYGQAIHYAEGGLPDESMMLHVAGIVSHGQYRRTPVTFSEGGAAAAWETIPDAMGRLFAHVEGVDPSDFVRAFLVIHPFEDGNGRVAFVLYNWIGGTLHTPQPLPEFAF